jgi:exodeoxyribonuclease V gamma subunit
MAIHLHISHSLKILFPRLAKNLLEEKSGPFTGRWIVTQTEGINNWIRYGLAERTGIAANLQFAKTNDIIYRIFQWIKPDAPAVMDRSTMTWHIYQQLQDSEFKKRFPDKGAYGEDDPVKQISLAMQIADLFDQYQVYRHDLISRWNQAVQKGEEANDWQQYLWMALKKELQERFLDRPQLADQLRQALQTSDNRSLLLRRIPQLHFFGMAIITPYYLDLFRQLSSFMELHFYLLNPCPDHPWMDTITEKQIAKLRARDTLPLPEDYLQKGNDLLLQWGRILKESFYLLVEHDDFVNAYNVLDSVSGIASPKTLLQKIHTDIYQNASAEDRMLLKPDDLKDQSILINGCYTPVREVEVLYNFILQCLSQERGERSLGARDILVLVSDIDAYAPIIHAVFRHGPKPIPYTIADESVAGGNSIFTALQEILSINLQTFKSEEVLALLDSPYIRRQFGFTDVEEIRQAVREASIFFGTSSVVQDQEHYEQSEAWMVSWEYGLKKMIYGLCISGEPSYYDGADQLLPLDTAEGSDMEDRIRLLHFFQVLRRHLLNREQERTLSAWADYLSDIMLEMILDPTTEEERDYIQFIEWVEEWKALGEENNDPVSFEVFRYAFFNRLEQEKRYRRFAGAGITFCSLVPMRSIPHRIVAMLGLNFDAFPRKGETCSFNKMTEKGNERVGDRNIRENDKHLFLETLLSAEETFYISYIARDQRDGAVRPPSSLVDQLIDHVARGMKSDADQLRKEWITIHPLHGFSSAYDGKKYISYLSDQYYQSSELPADQPKATPVFDFSALTLEQLQSFMENPPKVYLQKMLNVYYQDEEALIPDHEPFEMDRLQEWGIQNELFKKLFNSGILPESDAEKEWLRRLKQSGKIPLAAMGRASVQFIKEELEPYVATYRELTAGRKQRKIEIKLPLEQAVLSGNMDLVFDNRLIYVCDSSSVIKHLLRAWIRYITLVASGGPAELFFIYKTKQGIKWVECTDDQLSVAEAQRTLNQYYNFYCYGHTNWFYFHPELAREELKMIKADYLTFKSWYEETIENEREYRLKDPYLLKAVENGFYSETNFPVLQQQVLTIMQPLFERFPALFI